VISKEAFEAQRREERRVRAENDPRQQAERDKQWAATQHAEIRNMRVEDSHKALQIANPQILNPDAPSLRPKHP
jgi:hypothetical protein